MAKQVMSTQADLFENPIPDLAKTLAPDRHNKVLEQLQSLLAEAMAQLESDAEPRNDQD